MGIKLNQENKKRVMLTIFLLILVTMTNVVCFLEIVKQVDVTLTSKKGVEIGEEMWGSLYKGCYVLYLEQKERSDAVFYTPSDLYLKEHGTEEVIDSINHVIEEWKGEFEPYRFDIDYYATDGISEMKNTGNSIGLENNDMSNYGVYLILSFDEKGNFQVDVKKSEYNDVDELIRIFQKIDRENLLWETLVEESRLVKLTSIDQTLVFEEVTEALTSVEETLVSEVEIDIEKTKGLEISQKMVNPITSFQVIYAVPYDSNLVSYEQDSWYAKYSAINQAGAYDLYRISLIVLVILMFVMTSKRIWKTISYERKGKSYFFEAAVFGILFTFAFYDNYVYQIMDYQEELGSLFSNFDSTFQIFESTLAVFLLYSMWYFSILEIRPVFALGVGEYLRQYSLCYQIVPWTRRKGKKFLQEIEQIDFSKKSTKTIIKFMIIQFFILVFCSWFWIFEIPFLIIYFIVLFFLFEKKYDKIKKDYDLLLTSMNRMAQGDLETEIEENIGIFEPLREELGKIRVGFQKAVKEEVKSERMKSELITNVSHDLKTPLTAITTYIELLKKEDITEQERQSYIQTLEKKSFRLKELIEDLFEVSKANSKNVTLHLMEMDIINLLKQVSVEHKEKFAEKKLDLRFQITDEKIVLMLDSQKTYRIFENLFTNIEKYAMEGSRVYVIVQKKENQVQIILKNISAEELTVRPEELTERFVRGDSSRNTEGSGLGLAIAQSFTEVQNGSFLIEVDGDLFKVVIVWSTQF